MGKASSAKKVARAARAGGSRRPGQRRPIGFPLLVTLIVVLGTVLVVFARSSRDANAAPQVGVDHWHAAYGVAECGEFRPSLTGATTGGDRLGIHTHEDGLVHIEPLLDGAAGRNAKLQLFFDFVGLTATEDSVTFADGTSWTEGETTCDGEPAQIVIARWAEAQDAADGEKPNEVFTEDFDDIRFRNDREAYTVALVPEGQLEDIPVRPDILTELNQASEPPASSTTAPGDTTSTSTGSTDTTAPGDTTAPTDTTAPGDTTATTAAGDTTTETTAAP